MRNFWNSNRGEMNRVNWTMLMVYVVVAHLVVIGSMEMLCRLLTGHFNPLVGGFGLVAALLVSLRRIGETLFAPPILHARSRVVR